MPYVDTEWAVIAEGALPGGEVWANRWTIQETAVGADLDDATTAFRDFYLAWSNACYEDWTCTMLTFRNLATGLVVSPTWASMPGQITADNPLPTECAIRVSLSANPSRHGGPFMAGLSVAAVDDQGRLDVAFQTTFTNVLTALLAALDAANFALVLDSPSDTETKALTAVRLGRTFDVIRRRRNQVPEAYAAATLP